MDLLSGVFKPAQVDAYSTMHPPAAGGGLAGAAGSFSGEGAMCRPSSARVRQREPCPLGSPMHGRGAEHPRIPVRLVPQDRLAGHAIRVSAPLFARGSVGVLAVDEGGLPGEGKHAHLGGAGLQTRVLKYSSLGWPWRRPSPPVRKRRRCPPGQGSAPDRRWMSRVCTVMGSALLRKRAQELNSRAGGQVGDAFIRCYLALFIAGSRHFAHARRRSRKIAGKSELCLQKRRAIIPPTWQKFSWTYIRRCSLLPCLSHHSPG